jgi:serine/threonine protein kinase
MGSVYRVRDERSGQELALKRPATEGVPDNAGVLFEQEFHALAELEHPCIVRVFDYGVDATGPYYTMELLDGDDPFAHNITQFPTLRRNRTCSRFVRYVPYPSTCRTPRSTRYSAPG